LPMERSPFWASCPDRRRTEEITTGVIMPREIVERSSGYWIVNEHGVAYPEPFDSIEEALDKLESLDNCTHDWDADMDGFVSCQQCGEPHPDNLPEGHTHSLQDIRPDLFNPNGTRKADY